MLGGSDASICLDYQSAAAGYDVQLTVHSSFSSKPVSFHDLVEKFSLPDFFLGRPVESTNYLQFEPYVASVENTIINDASVRSKLACLYFGGETFPKVNQAVEKNFGILDKYFDINSSNRKRFEKRLEKILDE